MAKTLRQGLRMPAKPMPKQGSKPTKFISKADKDSPAGDKNQRSTSGNLKLPKTATNQSYGSKGKK